MKKAAIVVKLILILPAFSFGQVNDSTISKDWRIEVGYQNFRLLDKNSSPLLYSAHAGQIGGQLKKNKTNTMWDIAANFSIGSSQSKRFGQREAIVYDHYLLNGKRDSSIYVLNPGLSFVQGELTYSYYWKIKNSQSPIHVGGIVKDNFTYSALGADTWFFNQLSLMPSFRMELFNSPKSKLETELSIPIFSYLVRGPFAKDPSLPITSYFIANLKTGSNVASLNKFQQINFQLDYQYQLNNKKSIGISYKFMWMNCANIPDRNLQAYSNTFQLTYTF